MHGERWKQLPEHATRRLTNKMGPSACLTQGVLNNEIISWHREILAYHSKKLTYFPNKLEKRKFENNFKIIKRKQWMEVFWNCKTSLKG